jgi:hypothetical protein
MLAETRAAESTSPWNERTTRHYQVIFPQMAHWLPDAEAEQLRSEFRTELDTARAAGIQPKPWSLPHGPKLSDRRRVATIFFQS